MKQNKPLGTWVDLCGTCCIPGAGQSPANIDAFNAHSLTHCVLILEYHCHEDVFALIVPCYCSAYGWGCRSYTGLCHKLRLSGPAFLPLQFNVPGVLAAGPTVSRVFPEGRCSQAGFSAPLLSSLITETSSSTSGSNLVTWECISSLSSLLTCSIAPVIYRRLFCLRLLHSVCGCLLHPPLQEDFCNGCLM